MFLDTKKTHFTLFQLTFEAKYLKRCNSYRRDCLKT